MEVSFTKEYIESAAQAALAQFGYDCTVEIETDQILCVTVFSKDGVELDGRCKKFRFCATPELARSPMAGYHRKNYYFWEEGLQKFASEAFWFRRGGEIRGASDDSFKRFMFGYNAARVERTAENYRRYYEVHRQEIAARNKAYKESHREDTKARCKSYHESHREQHLVRYKAYNESHRNEILAQKKAEREQLWTNGTETLKWNILYHRGRKGGLRKADLLAQGWHPIE